MPPPSSLVSPGNPGLWSPSYVKESFGAPMPPHLSPFSPPSTHSSVPGDSWYYRMQSTGYGSHETMFPYAAGGPDNRSAPTRPNFSYHMWI